MDRVSARTDPLTRQERFTYDANGNPTTHTDRKSQVTSRIYDALDRLSVVAFADSSTITYSYDAANRVIQFVDSLTGTITRSYDGLDRLIQETTPEGTVSYTYDAASRRVTMTVTGQTPVNYTYDVANRLAQIQQGADVVTFAYDPAGRRTSQTLPNGVKTTSTSDAASRLIGLTYTHDQTTLGTLTYVYDPAGKRQQVGGTWARTGIPVPISGASYDAANQQIAFNGQTLTFDLNGNLTSDGTTTYTWNARNQLVGLARAGLAASFVYDATARRRSKTLNSLTTSYLYDRLNPVKEIHPAGTTDLLPALDIDHHLLRTDAFGSVAHVSDVLGSTMALTDSTGSVTTSYTYEPFGATTPSGLTNSNAFQYAGRDNDGIGLYYYRARYYRADLQRFIREDPIGFSGGDVNLYAFVNNSPTMHTDPTGLAVGACSQFPAMVQQALLGFPVVLAGRKDSIPVLAAITPQTPWSYGNYCGIGGSGAPYDRLDEICKAHDDCYRRCKASAYDNFPGNRAGGEKRKCMNPSVANREGGQAAFSAFR